MTIIILDDFLKIEHGKSEGANLGDLGWVGNQLGKCLPTPKSYGCAFQGQHLLSALVLHSCIETDQSWKCFLAYGETCCKPKRGQHCTDSTSPNTDLWNGLTSIICWTCRLMVTRSGLGATLEAHSTTMGGLNCVGGCKERRGEGSMKEGALMQSWKRKGSP